MISAVPASAHRSGHIGLNVTDLARARDFYAEVFGFMVMEESWEPDNRFIFLGDGERVVLALWEDGTGRFNAGGPGLHHVSFEVDDIKLVMAAQQRLQALGTRVFYDGIVPHAHGRSSGGIFFEDPDGIRLEIYAPSGADAFGPAPLKDRSSCDFFF